VAEVAAYLPTPQNRYPAAVCSDQVSCCHSPGKDCPFQVHAVACSAAGSIPYKENEMALVPAPIVDIVNTVGTVQTKG